ncbi:MAG: hypothetical protein AAGE52_05690 [Myxococcota bacterium]
MNDGLGRWVPPDESVVRRSAWRADPERAAVPYALALLGGALVVALAWVFFPRSDADLDPALSEMLRARLAAETAPQVVATVFASVLLLGTTKRCFGFDRGTFAAFVVMGVHFVPVRFLPGGLAIGAGVGLGASLLFMLAPWPRETRRRAFAGLSFASLAAFAVLSARADYGFPSADPGLTARLTISIGMASTTAGAAALWLVTAGRTRKTKDASENRS